MSGTVKRRSTKNKQKQRDTFSETWGTSTAWRSGIPRHLRPGLVQEDVFLRSKPAPPVVKAASGVPITLDKPLPAVPLEKPQPSIPDGPNISINAIPPSLGLRESRSSEQQWDTANASLSTLLNLMRKLGVFRVSSKRSSPVPQAQQSASQDPLHLSSQPPEKASIPPVSEDRVLPAVPLSPPMLRRGKSTPRHSTAIVLSQLLSGSVYVDASTQTSPRLLAMHRPTRSLQTSNSASPRTLSSIRRPNIGRQESTLSPLTGPKKGFWVKMAPNDYFSVPFRQDKALSPSTTGSLATDSGSNVSVLLDRPALKDSDVASTKSGDSIGTYESRYSASDSESEAGACRRPSLSRPAVSDSMLVSDRSSSSSAGTERPSARPSVQIRSSTSEQVNRRPMPMPFTRLPSFSANRGRRFQSSSDGSSRSSVSPLRQSIKMPDTPPISRFTPPSPGVYQQPVVTPDPQSEYMTFIPDHLAGSPLCPRSPKHVSGGSGFCPMHGRNDESGTSTPLVVTAGSGKSIRLKLSDRSPSSGESCIDGSVDETLLRNPCLGTFRHNARNRDVPVNPCAKGICIVHGRFKLRPKHISEESITQVRLRRY